ncbi:hypothetical protein M408DRAFT_325802 [Serendipita vermifera MAFF 305830]|uniref:Uncharacterized protein n=1 Tax=Serendipita vermifera MAFF 305830 TaxID=933852 RepID=A0A0C3BC37_SERVB|nr:hypothetical protein M408DRAFT_325802 [Serendipita vermifera MAFF 305830]
MTTVNVSMDVSPAFDASSPPSGTSSSTVPQRAALAPLQNHNFPSTTPKVAASKPTSPTVYTPYSRPQQSRVTPKPTLTTNLEVSGDAVSAPPVSTSSAAMMLVDTASSPPRAAYLERFDYIEMRCKMTRTELPKKPHPNEIGIVFHSPAEPYVTYDTFFQTTHDFLDVSSTLHVFPTFVDLPLHLRPSKVRYDATKQSEDLMLRVRCLFCRGRFGGKNAKAIWERHVKEHWPKQDRVKEFTKEETRRPMRQIQKRPTGSNAHSRTRSHDSSAWAPNARYNESNCSASPSSYSASSRASSPEFELQDVYPNHHAPLRATSPTCFPPQHSSCSDHDSDVEVVEPRTSFFRSPIRSPRKRATRPRAHPYPRRPPSSDYTDEEDEGYTSFLIPQSCWDIDADLDAISQAAKPCLSKDEMQAALDAMMSRVDEIRSPIEFSSPVPVISFATRALALKNNREEDMELYASNAKSYREHKRQLTETDVSSSEDSCSGSSGEESFDASKSSSSASSSGSDDSVMVDARSDEWLAESA